jgi:hypothetical protein
MSLRDSVDRIHTDEDFVCCVAKGHIRFKKLMTATEEFGEHARINFADDSRSSLSVNIRIM